MEICAKSGRLTRLVWVQLVVGKQNEATSLQQTLFDVQSEASGLKSDQLLPLWGLGAIHSQSAHVQGFVQESEVRRTLGYRLQLMAMTHEVSYGPFNLCSVSDYPICYKKQFLNKEEAVGTSADLEG